MAHEKALQNTVCSKICVLRFEDWKERWIVQIWETYSLVRKLRSLTEPLSRPDFFFSLLGRTAPQILNHFQSTSKSKHKIVHKNNWHHKWLQIYGCTFSISNIPSPQRVDYLLFASRKSVKFVQLMISSGQECNVENILVKLVLAVVVIFVASDLIKDWSLGGEPLGMEDGTIPDENMTASSSAGPAPPHLARLNALSAWCAGKAEDCFLQVRTRRLKA